MSRTRSSIARTAPTAQMWWSVGVFMSPPAFSRPAKPDRQFVEVRPMLPMEVVAVLDAIALAEGSDRTKVVTRACQEYAAAHHRRATLIVRASRGNPTLSDTED